MSDRVSAHAGKGEAKRASPTTALHWPGGLIWTGPIDTTPGRANCRQGSPVPSRPVPVWLYVPVRQSYCYIYGIQTIGVAHASTTTASSPSVRALALAIAARRRSRMDQNNSNRQQQQAPPPPPAGQIDRSIVISEYSVWMDIGRIDGHILLTWLACRLPDGRRGAAGRQRQEAGTPGEDDLARGEGLHRRMVNYQSQT